MGFWKYARCRDKFSHVLPPSRPGNQFEILPFSDNRFAIFQSLKSLLQKRWKPRYKKINIKLVINTPRHKRFYLHAHPWPAHTSVCDQSDSHMTPQPAVSKKQHLWNIMKYYEIQCLSVTGMWVQWFKQAWPMGGPTTSKVGVPKNPAVFYQRWFCSIDRLNLPQYPQWGIP